MSQLPDTSVKLPTATSSAIRQVDVTDTRKQQFKRECKQILISMLKKFLERSPIQYKICRASSAIAPGNMINKKARSITYFAALCDQLYDKKFLKSNEADAAKGQRERFLDDIVMKNRELSIAFDYRKQSFDLFLGQFLHGNEQYKLMWKVMVYLYSLFRMGRVRLNEDST